MSHYQSILSSAHLTVCREISFSCICTSDDSSSLINASYYSTLRVEQQATSCLWIDQSQLFPFLIGTHLNYNLMYRNIVKQGCPKKSLTSTLILANVAIKKAPLQLDTALKDMCTVNIPETLLVPQPQPS